MRIKIGNKIYENDCLESEHYEDLLRLQHLMEELGFPKLSLNEIEDMWNKISDSYYASWLGVPINAEDLVEYLSEIKVR